MNFDSEAIAKLVKNYPQPKTEEIPAVLNDGTEVTWTCHKFDHDEVDSWIESTGVLDDFAQICADAIAKGEV